MDSIGNGEVLKGVDTGKSEVVNRPSELEERLRVQKAMRIADTQGLKGREKYEAYKDSLPPNVEFVGLPEDALNCAGYALDLDRSTQDPAAFINADFDEVESPEGAEIYVLHPSSERTIEDNWIHIGKILEDGGAESKWGWTEPIFRHPITFYPSEYKKITYYKRKAAA